MHVAFLFKGLTLFCIHTFCSLSWIEVNGSVYKQGSVVVLGMEDGMPAFGIIEDIIVFCTDMFYLVCSVYRVFFTPLSCISSS